MEDKEVKKEEIRQEELPEEETEAPVEEKEETAEEKPQEEESEKGHKLFSKKENKEIARLKEEVKDLKEQLAASKNDYYKAYADTQNMKKRLQADFDMHMKYHIQSFASEILPSIDNLERAMNSIEDKESSLYRGVQMVYDQLINALKKEGVEEIEALNLPFDPNFHNALMMEKVEGVEPNTVIEVLQKGYKYKDRILRATLVKVSE